MRWRASGPGSTYQQHAGIVARERMRVMSKDQVSARHTGPFFVTISEDVIERLLEADASAIKTYLVLRRGCACRRDGWFWRHGHEQIAGEAGVSPSSVKRAVRWLVAGGLVAVEERTGRNGQLAHRYQIPQLGVGPLPPLCARCGSPFHAEDDGVCEVQPAGSPMTRPDGSPTTTPSGHPRPGHGRVTGDPAEVDRGGRQDGGRSPLPPVRDADITSTEDAGRPASVIAHFVARQAATAAFLPSAIAWLRQQPDGARIVRSPTHGDILALLKARGRYMPAGVRGRRAVAAAALAEAGRQLDAELGRAFRRASVRELLDGLDEPAAHWWAAVEDDVRRLASHGPVLDLADVGVDGVRYAWLGIVRPGDVPSPHELSAEQLAAKTWLLSLLELYRKATATVEQLTEQGEDPALADWRAYDAAKLADDIIERAVALDGGAA